MTFSDYDEDAGYLFELLGWKNLARQGEIEKAKMFYVFTRAGYHYTTKADYVTLGKTL